MNAKCIIAILSIMLLLSMVTPSFATTYYVSKSGSDSRSGTSWSQAWLTVEKVNSVLQAGDTVFFGTGIWYESQIRPPAGGSYNNRTVYACSTYSDATRGRAHIWAGGLLTGWTSVGGNKYRANYSGSKSNTLGQDHVLLDPEGSVSAVDQPGEFYHDTGSNQVYVWLYENKNPNNCTMIISSNKAVSLAIAGIGHVQFFGLDFKYGELATVDFHATCDSVFFVHCNITHGSGNEGTNCGAVFFRADGPHPRDATNDATFGRYNTFRACSLGHVMEERGADYGHVMTTYSENHVYIESCTVFPPFGNGIYFKDKMVTPKHTGMVARFNTIHGAAQHAVLWTSHANRDSVYGNVIYDCNMGIINGGSNSPPFLGRLFICNNTIYDVWDVGLSFADNGATCGDSNIVKYNVIAGCSLPAGRRIIGFSYVDPPCFATYTIDSNMYYNPTEWFDVCEADHSFENWQDHGYDVRGFDNLDPGFANPYISDFTRVGAPIQMNRADYGDRQWRVWGAIQPTGGCDPPGVPGLYSPTNGASNLSQPISFDWSNVSGASKYQLVIDNNSSFNSPEINVQPTQSQYSVSGLSAGTTFYWHVRAYNDCGWGQWSSLRSFSTENGCSPPGTSTLIGPANGSVNMELPILLDWSNVSGADLYWVQVDNNSSFTSPELEYLPTSSYFSASYNLLPETTYYWRVAAHNSCGWGNWSVYYHFTTATQSGSDVTPPTISNVHDGDTTTTTALIVWDTDESATSQVWYMAGLAGGDSTIATTVYVVDHQVLLTGLFPGTLYQYVVRSADQADNLAQSNPHTFTTSGISLDAEEFFEALGRPVYTSSQPILVVRNAGNSGENSYYFEVATDTNFVNVITSSFAIPQQIGDTTSWRVNSILQQEEIYYWRANLNHDKYSDYCTFTVQPAPHVYPNPFDMDNTPQLVFREIPAGATLLLTTASGETVRRWIDTTGDDIAWDGTNGYGRKVAPGVYLWYIEQTGIHGKFTVVR